MQNSKTRQSYFDFIISYLQLKYFDYYFEVVLVWTNNDQSDFNYPNQLWRYSKLGAPTEPNSSPSGSYSASDFGSISVS
jgi:hypothetical protein